MNMEEFLDRDNFSGIADLTDWPVDDETRSRVDSLFKSDDQDWDLKGNDDASTTAH